MGMDLLDNLARSVQLQRDSEEAGIQFLTVEIETGLIFAKIACEAGADTDKQQRNQAHAHKAYETIMNLRKRLAKSESAAVRLLDLADGIEQLRIALQELAELSQPTTSSPISDRRRMLRS